MGGVVTGFGVESADQRGLSAAAFLFPVTGTPLKGVSPT